MQSLTFVIFFLLLATIFFISRFTTNEIFYFLRIFIKDENLISSLISLFFLPGTILHELAHFFAASILLLRVRSVSIFPSRQENYIKLGSVIYEKKDVLRGILVGIAPVFVGLIFFYLIDATKLFPATNIFLNLIMFYLIFSVSSTMFSSKQDLVDLIFVLPLILVFFAFLYIFDIKINLLLENKAIVNNFLLFLGKINQYLIFTLLINLLLIIVLKVTRSILKK